MVDDAIHRVYIAGSGDVFGDWGCETNGCDPRLAAKALTSNGDGTCHVTIDFAPGTQELFKFTRENNDFSGDAWDNGQKAWAGVDDGQTCGSSGGADCACAAALADTAWLAAQGITYEQMEGGLWEVVQDLAVPDDGSTTFSVPPTDIEAWRDYASDTYNYYGSCD